MNRQRSARRPRHATGCRCVAAGAVAIGVAAGIAAPGRAVAADPSPGLWEYRIEVQAPGTKVPAQTVRHCLTAKDIAERRQYAGDPEGRCTMSNFRQVGDQVSYDTSCELQGARMTAISTGTTSADRIHVETRMRVEGGPVPELRQVLDGRRVGECRG